MNYKELSNVFKKISKWDSKKTKVLSIKTRPFNTIAVFSNIINKTICKNKNILYIFCNREKKYASEKIKELKKDERKLLYLRYFADKTQTEIGEELGISQVQVSRMEKKILKTMREHAKE